MKFRPRRSALYLPASNARAIEKARSSEADVVILDLEDAVSPELKLIARDQAIAAVGAGGFGRRELVVRINGLDTEWGDGDLRAATNVAGCAILLPKVSSPEVLSRAHEIIGNGSAELWAMIETARGVVNLSAIVDSAATYRLTTLVAGTNDLAKELRCLPGSDRGPLLPILAKVVLCARMAGLAALDGVTNVLDNELAVEAECRQGLALGFDGKTLIHPSQVAPANRVFAPSADQIDWARRVAAAFDDPTNAGKGVLRIEARMVELLHLVEARRTLEIAAALEIN